MTRASVASAASLAVTAAMILTSATAGAAPSARLVYVREKGAEDCPDEAALRAAVAARLGYDPFLPAASATLFAEIWRAPGAYRARVKLVDEDNVVRGARELEHTGPHCSDLVDAMALTMSIAIDPRSLIAPVAPEAPAPLPVPVPVPVPAPAPDPVPDRPPAPPAPRAPTHLFAALTPTTTLGAAPAAAVGIVGSVGLQSRPFSIALEARGDLPASRDVPLGTVSTSLLAATVAPCFARGIVMACALGTVGRLLGEARGIRDPRSDSAVHALAGGRLGVAEPLTSTVDLRANVDVLYALTPQILRIDGQDAYSLPRLSVQLALGVVIHFF